MKRNFDGIQFAELRKTFDAKFNDVHDELTAAYYGKKPFRTYGVLDKAMFDKLHGLLFQQYDAQFHIANQKQSKPYSEAEYNYAAAPQNAASKGLTVLTVNGEQMVRKSDLAVASISALKAKGLELVI